MISNTTLEASRSHELAIQMKTSSGDTLSLNFENSQELSLNSKQNGNAKEGSFSFKSLQAFSFEFQSNGLSEQDKQEIDAFMKVAQPYIDKFMKELESQNQTTPVNKIASDVTSLIKDLRYKDENTKNYAKSGIVDLFDNALKTGTAHEKMIEEAQKLMQKILDGFDSVFTPVYA